MIKTQSRQVLRQHFRQYRQQLSITQQQHASEGLVHMAFHHDLFANTKRVACYLANDGELDLMPLIHTLWKQEVETYLPVLHPFTKGHLLFIQYNKNTPMINNHFGIQEPKLNIQTMVKPDTLDCILVPLVAFDRKGNRLGMGGGFYDRTLAPVNEMNSDKPRLIGVAHEGQMATQLPYQGWDIPMQNILTPQQLFKPEI